MSDTSSPSTPSRADTMAALALRTQVTPNGAAQRVRYAQCAYFSGAFTELLQEAARFRGLPPRVVEGVKVEFLTNGQIDAVFFDEAQNLQPFQAMADDLPSAVALLNRQLQPLGVTPIGYQQGLQRVSALETARRIQEAGTDTAAVWRATGRAFK